MQGSSEALKGLNEAQKRAVMHDAGPLLIIAGAGAGKTKVITHRILRLIESGVEPERILAVTFTNKAAKEMSERIRALLGRQGRYGIAGMPFVSTFHALGVHILREHHRRFGLSRHFTIFDRADSLQAIKRAMREADLDPKSNEPRKFLGAISRQKGNGVSLNEYAQGPQEYFASLLRAVWSRYENILREEKALDFDDLLLKTLHLLKEDTAVRAAYEDRWHYIHIDEYQDTNRVQYLIAKLLAGERANICVVGDIDQSIYSWRGADIENVLSFERTYPSAKVVLLEQNYRSTQTILNASNEIIKKNRRRREKNLFTQNAAGERILLRGCYDEADEGRYVIERAVSLIGRGVAPREIAVLYRANFQSRALEEACIRSGVPYQVLGVRFFERKEVKDVLAYLRASAHPENLADIKRIINVPARGIGKVTLLKIAEGKAEALSPALRAKVRDFYALLERIRSFAAEHPISRTVRHILVESGLEETLKTGDEEDLERLENLRELVTLSLRYDEMPPQEAAAQLLSDAALATDQDELKEDRNTLKLMTVHAAKGLEFDYVFITGLEAGLFPHRALSEERADSEEERRLFYVALTRARKRVFLTFASVRTIFGAREINIPSEFITDIDETLIETDTEEARAPEASAVIYLD